MLERRQHRGYMMGEVKLDLELFARNVHSQPWERSPKTVSILRAQNWRRFWKSTLSLVLEQLLGLTWLEKRVCLIRYIFILSIDWWSLTWTTSLGLRSSSLSSCEIYSCFQTTLFHPARARNANHRLILRNESLPLSAAKTLGSSLFINCTLGVLS